MTTEPDLAFVVFGIPAPKGSKRAFVQGGRVNVVDVNRPKLKVWSGAVNDVVQGIAEAGTGRLDGPLEAAIEFYLPRPSSEPKRRRTWPIRKPDLDKLTRAILDPLTGVVIADDARIVRLVVAKDFAEASGDPRPRAEVRLWRITAAADGSFRTEGGETTPQMDLLGPTEATGREGGSGRSSGLRPEPTSSVRDTGPGPMRSPAGVVAP